MRGSDSLVMDIPSWPLRVHMAVQRLQHSASALTAAASERRRIAGFMALVWGVVAPRDNPGPSFR